MADSRNVVLVIRRGGSRDKGVEEVILGVWTGVDDTGNVDNEANDASVHEMILGKVPSRKNGEEAWKWLSRLRRKR